MSDSLVTYKFAEFVLNPSKRTLFEGTIQQQLSGKDFGVLLFLIESAPKICSHNEIIESVWKRDHVEQNSVDKSIAKIRKVLVEDSSNPRFVKNVWGEGFLFFGDVERVDGNAVEKTPVIEKLTDKRHAFIPLGISSQGPPDEDIRWLTDILHGKPAFKSFDVDILAEFVRNFEVVELNQYDTVWRERDGTELDFMVVLDGCLAAWGDTWDEDSVDALVSKGQILGEAELFEFDTTCRKLVTLMKSRLLVAPRAAIDSFRTGPHGFMLYETLCISLIEKIRAQNFLLKVRTGQNDRRLVKFIDNFTMDPSWRDLTNMGDSTNIKNRFRKDNVRIELFFTAELLSDLLYSKSRHIAPVVKNFIEWEILRMYQVDEDFNISDEPVSHSKFPRVGFPNFPYFQLELVDHTELMRALDPNF